MSKEVIEAQEKTITDLLQAVKEQHDQLDNQKSKIKILEEKVKTPQRNKHLPLALFQNLSNSLGNIIIILYYNIADWKLCTICVINKLSYFFPAPLTQISYDSFQDTVDKSMDQDNSVYDMFTYLTGNATSQEISGMSRWIVSWLIFAV